MLVSQLDMDYESMRAQFEDEYEEKGDRKISISDHQVNGETKSDSFVVDMQDFSHHLTGKFDDDTANSRFSSNLSRAGLIKSCVKKINPIAGNAKSTSTGATSPRALLHESIMPEKPTVGSSDDSINNQIHPINHQIHHQITIVKGTESKFGGKKNDCRRSSPFWTLDMDYGNMRAKSEDEFEQKDDRKFSVSDHQVDGGTKSDSFVVDMQDFSHHLTGKDDDGTAKLRFSSNHLQEGSIKGCVKKINPIAANDKSTSNGSTSPRAPLHGHIMPEKQAVETVGPTDDSINHQIRPINHQIHHQITITKGSTSNKGTESKFCGKRHSCRGSSPFWMVSPRRILFFVASLSSIGTLLLIYFTLSMGNEDETLSIDNIQ